jgi:hypothetical protein
VATSCTPDSAKQTAGGSSAPNAYSIDIFYPPGQAVNSSAIDSTAQDDVHHCGDSPPTITITSPSDGDNCSGSCTITATAFSGTHPLNDPSYAQFPGTITISVGGNTICSKNANDGEPISCDYSPTTSSSGSITATVTDSVLYSAATSVTVNFTATGGSLSISNTGNTINWASYSGADHYAVHWIKAGNHTSNTNNTSFVVSNNSTDIYVEAIDSGGNVIATSNHIPST